MNQNNKIALVTGGSRGLGKDTALSLAKKGHDIIITYRTKKEEANKVVAEISSLGRKATALQLDIGKISDLDSFVQDVNQALKNNWGRKTFDFLINNAGIIAHVSVAETTEETFDALMNIHLKGVFFLTQKLLPKMEKGGRIVNFSTGLTRFAFPGYGAYAAMKGGIEVYTKYLARELGVRGITANVIAPGAIDTDMNKAAFDANPDVVNMISSMTALGRIGHAEDIGGVVAFLCSPEAGWVNGQRIEASGGMNL